MTIYVLSPTMTEGRAAFTHLKATTTSEEVVVVVHEDGMRGRTVDTNDRVVTAGGWDHAPSDKVANLITAFNACRKASSDAPYLTFKPGEAPLVKYLEDGESVPPTTQMWGTPPITLRRGPLSWAELTTEEPTTVEEPTYTTTFKDGGVLYLDGDAIEVANVEIEQQGRSGERLSIEIRAISRKGGLRSDKATIRDLLGKREQDLRMAKSLMKRIDRLSEWLTDVQPVEDEDIPGVFRCGVCHKQIPAHAVGCPVMEP